MKLIFGGVTLAAGVDCEEEPFALTVEVVGAVQIAHALRSTSAAPIDRGNRRTELRFSVMRRHASVSEATNYLLRHGAELADVESSMAIIGEGAAQKSTFRLAAAVLRSVHGVQDGATTTHSYAIVGGMLSVEDGSV
ncbi:MAG: hypothetical protein LBI39_04010 [Puniceicoccales bacterium]|nr:hypothetical protein [Puniceicoccales bacterium]